MIPDVSFGDLVAVCAIGFLIPLALGFFPGLRLPAVALQIVAGIVVGPAVEAIGFGFLVPVFFVASGLGFDLGALTHDAWALAKVPALVAAGLVSVIVFPGAALAVLAVDSRDAASLPSTP